MTKQKRPRGRPRIHPLPDIEPSTRVTVTDSRGRVVGEHANVPGYWTEKDIRLRLGIGPHLIVTRHRSPPDAQQ